MAAKNPVGRPKKTYGKETLLNHKKSFKLDKNVVVDKFVDAIILVAVLLIVLYIILRFMIYEAPSSAFF